MSQTERLYWTDAQIRSGRYPNADSICARFGVSRRTAFNDRDYLKERLHAPLVFDREHGGWTYTDRPPQARMPLCPARCLKAQKS